MSLREDTDMKKRNFAVALLMCITLAGCGNAAPSRGLLAANVLSGELDPTPTEAPHYTQAQIDKRIREVGERYDGLYSYDYDYSNGGMLFLAEVCTEECDAEAVSGGATQSVSNGNTGYIGVTQDVDWNTENYNAVKESGFVSVNTQPFSTFGADVDTAVYSNFRRSVYENDGFGISGDAIRIEEMVNYFNHNH